MTAPALFILLMAVRRRFTLTSPTFVGGLFVFCGTFRQAYLLTRLPPCYGAPLPFGARTFLLRARRESGHLLGTLYERTTNCNTKNASIQYGQNQVRKAYFIRTAAIRNIKKLGSQSASQGCKIPSTAMVLPHTKRM